MDFVQNSRERLQVFKPVALGQGDGLPQGIAVSILNGSGPVGRAAPGGLRRADAVEGFLPRCFAGLLGLAFFVEA